nr:uncharacterized protein LOC127315514 [Lolium perenne]
MKPIRPGVGGVVPYPNPVAGFLLRNPRPRTPHCPRCFASSQSLAPPPRRRRSCWRRRRRAGYARAGDGGDVRREAAPQSPHFHALSPTEENRAAAAAPTTRPGTKPSACSKTAKGALATAASASTRSGDGGRERAPGDGSGEGAALGDGGGERAAGNDGGKRVPARRQRLRRRRRVTWREAPPACLHRRSADPSSSWPTPRELLDGGGPAARCSAGPEVDEQQVAVDLDLLHPGG